MQNAANSSALAGTGITGLDRVLQGGLPPGRIYLVEGAPGVGKTTLGLQFLLEGVRAGQRVMLVSLIETQDELLDVAQSHGWSLDAVHVMQIPHQVKASALEPQTVFPPGEVEFNELADAIVEDVESYRPERLLIDSVSQLSMLSDTWQQMRSSILKIRDLAHSLGTTTLMTSSKVERQISELDTIVHGTITLSASEPDFGQVQRQLIVKKLRGHRYFTGIHNYRIRTGGLEVFTWSRTEQVSPLHTWQQISSGNQDLDKLLGGGLEQGSSCLITGTTGAGKSTIASLYVQAAARRATGSVYLCFDERKETYLRRCASLNLQIPEYVDQGLVQLHQIGSGSISPGEFCHIAVDYTEKINAGVVVIDSLSGYLNAIPGEKNLMSQLHELLDYLSTRGVLTIMIMTREHTSGISDTGIDASYLADTVVVLRHFEALGTIRRCMAVVKKRHSSHEHTIREFKVTGDGFQVGQPLKDFNGVLSGTPQYYGKIEKLIDYR